jgi:putative transposase
LVNKNYLTAKIKLKPTGEQTDILWQLSEAARQTYNLALEQRRMLRNNFRANISYNKQSAQLTQIRKEYFSSLHSQTAQSVLKDLDEAFKSYYALVKADSKARPPKFRGKKYFYTLTYPQNSYHFEGNNLVLHNPDRLTLKMAGFRDIPRTKAIKQIEVSEEKGNFYVNVTCEVTPEQVAKTGKIIAFDPGVKTILAGFDGEQFVTVDGTIIKKTQKHYAHTLDRLQSKIDRSKKGSKRHRRLIKAKKRALRKRSARVKQVSHCISKTLASMEYDAYLIGDWSKKDSLADTKSRKGNRVINRAVQNQLPLAKLTDYLFYKTALKSKQVRKVSEERSSQTCSNCNHIQEIRLTQRIFHCESCGTKINRDDNAAVNLYRWNAGPVTGPFDKLERIRLRFVFSRFNACLTSA